MIDFPSDWNSPKEDAMIDDETDPLKDAAHHAYMDRDTRALKELTKDGAPEPGNLSAMLQGILLDPYRGK